MIPATLRNAAASSLLLHITIIVLVALVVGKEQRIAKTDYIPVEVIQLSPATKKSLSITPKATHIEKGRKQLSSAPSIPALQQNLPVIRESTPQVAPASMSYPVQQQNIPPPQQIKGVTTPQANNTQTVTSGVPSPHAKHEMVEYQPIHRLTRLPNYLTRIEPVYPATERLAGVEARVLTEVYINAQGGVDDVKIKKSGGRVFDQAVIAAVRNSRFAPGFRGDTPVPTALQIPFSFKMK